MELNNFVNKTITSANEAKNFLSLLIGFDFSGKEKAKALIELYESFPEEYKKEEKLFAPIIFKLLSKYGVLQEHELYYKKFYSYWSISEQEIIKKENPQIDLSYFQKEFKNSLELARALSTYFNYGNKIETGFVFLKNQEDCIKKLIQKDKNKIIENFHKQNCWRNLIEKDYLKFKEFCIKYKIDYLNVFKEEFIENFSGLKSITYKATDEQLKLIMEDLITIKKDIESLFMTQTKEDKPNIFHIALICLSENKQISFNFIFKNFKDELQNCIAYYSSHGKKTLNIINGNDWLEAIQAIERDSKSYSSNKVFYDSDIYQIKNKIDIKTLNTTILAIQLEEQLEEKTEKQKKFKI